jgi:hypothetical protein
MIAERLFRPNFFEAALSLKTISDDSLTGIGIDRFFIMVTMVYHQYTIGQHKNRFILLWYTASDILPL